MIRKATNQDIPQATRLVYSVLREYGLQPDPHATDADLLDLDKHYFRNGGSFEVLLDASGIIVGTVGILRISDEVCELRKMYLDPGHRGMGKGKLLLERGLDMARELGFKRITLETAGVLKEAISLYTKYGFREYQAPQVSCRCDRTYYLDLQP